MNRTFRGPEGDVPTTIARDRERWLVQVPEGAQALPATRAGDGSWLVDGPAGRRRFWVSVQPDRCLVADRGRVLEFKSVDPDAGDLDAGPQAGPRLLAEMPGKVVQACVEVGQEVARGQALVIMESMKMETELGSPVPGRILAVHVTAGQVVGQGDLLVEIEPAAPPT